MLPTLQQVFSRTLLLLTYPSTGEETLCVSPSFSLNGRRELSLTSFWRVLSKQLHSFLVPAHTPLTLLLGMTLEKGDTLREKLLGWAPEEKQKLFR